MKQHLKLMVPLVLMTLLLLTGCELRRDGGEGDISADTPVPEMLDTSPLAPASPAPTVVRPAAIPDIDVAAVPAPPPPPAEVVEPGKVLVKLTDEAAVQARSAEIGSAGISSLDEILLQFEASSLEPVLDDVADVTDQDPDELSIQAEQVGSLFFVTYEADVPPAEVATALEENPSVEYSEPNFIAGIAGSPGYTPSQFEPNDPYYKFQWHYQKIGMPAAWDLSTGSDVIIAVIDTGIDFNAPDLANTGRVPGYDFVNNDSDPTDDQGHGTHVAGTVAQSTNNGVGVAGVAYRARLMPVKTLGSDGNGTYENIIKGIIYAVDRGAQVINLSLAGASPSASLLDAVNYAHSRGVVVVAAAGNAGGPVSYPAAYDGQVLAVAATRYDNARSNYSNFGPEIDLAAPGGDIDVDQTGDGYADGILQQTRKSGGGYSYQFWEGTSMAAPHVAGLAGLLLAVRPNASPAEIEAVMAQTALQGLGSTDQYGAGLIQADAALRAFVPVPNTPTPTFTSAPPTATFTAVPPTPTFTAVPPTATFTPMPPTATLTPLPPTSTPSPTPSLTLTPSPTIGPVCTPPACDPGGILVCPGGDCPSGCGVVCVTPTPGSPSPTPTFSPTPSPSPSPTQLPPTVTPTPTGPSLPAGELLLNGDFETDEGWTFGDTPVRGGYDTSIARSGKQSARLGIVSPPDRYSFTSAWQKAVIPADAKQVTLTTHIFPVSQDQPGRDAQNILLLNSGFRIIRRLASGVSNSQTWDVRSYDLTDLRGQTIYIYFGVFNNGAGNKPTAMFVDDVSLSYTR